MYSEGYCTSVCASMLISPLGATNLMVSDTNGFSMASSQKTKWRISYNGRIQGGETGTFAD